MEWDVNPIEMIPTHAARNSLPSLELKLFSMSVKVAVPLLVPPRAYSEAGRR